MIIQLSPEKAEQNFHFRIDQISIILHSIIQNEFKKITFSIEYYSTLICQLLSIIQLLFSIEYYSLASY